MSKYKLSDLKVGAVFKSKYAISTIIRVGKSEVCYSYQSTLSYAEKFCSIESLLRGEKGELVKPDIKTNKIKTQKGTVAWAMVQLVKGLRVRHEGWDSGKYINLVEYGDCDWWLPLVTRGKNAAGWELYEEKEEKTK